MHEPNYGQPAFLGLVVGLLLAEETSLSWLNSAILVQGIPSASSYMLVNGNSSDWIYKAQVACLVCSSATDGDIQRFLYVVGVSLSCISLLANLGSRAWHFLRWRQISFGGPLAPLLAFCVALAAGLCLPHMGHRNVPCGGKVAVETSINNAFWVSGLFLLSNAGTIQRVLLGGIEVGTVVSLVSAECSCFKSYSCLSGFSVRRNA